MDSLANYGSDDEYDENTSEKMGTSGSGGNRTRSRDVDNYDEVQMDLSEESNNNISAEDDDQKVEKPSEKKRLNRSHSRDDPRSSRSSDSRSKRDDRDKDRYRRDREDRYEKKYDKISKTRDDKRRKRSPSREKKRSISKDRKRSSSRERRRSNSRNRRSGSREKRRSGSKERRRSGSKERRRSGSKERRRSRSPRRDERRRRSSSKDRTSGSNSRYGKRFDRTSNKIAQLEKLGIELPKYYNPAAMNPARYADQIQKRRLLWQKKDPVVTTEAKPMGKVWEQTTFAQDSDGKVASKFKRLMGIKDQPGPSGKDTSKDILKKQEEMFSSMEQQYEVARTATHTMRGVGLGFGAFNNYPR